MHLLADTLGWLHFTKLQGLQIGFNAYPEYPLFAITLGLIIARKGIIL